MFVIGRNVEVKVEDGVLTIKCQVENVVPRVSDSGKNLELASTRGWVNVPRTDLRLTLSIHRPKTE